MGAKGSSKTCCCGGCAMPPWELQFVDQRDYVQKLQAYCCSCIPIQLCVHYECDDAQETYTGLFDAIHICDGEGNEAVQYRGNLLVNDQLITDARIYFKVEGTTCYLCVESYTLSISETCVEITDYIRAELCPRCTPCPVDHDILTWDVTGGFCNGPATISIRQAANTSLAKHPQCCDCPDPCDDQPYFDEYEDFDDSCGGLCGGCGCICSLACITVVRANVIASHEVVKLCRWKYRTSTGIVIEIVQNYTTGCCELELSSVGDIQPTGDVFNVPIGGIANRCPNPTARWQFGDDSLQEPDNQVVVIFECATCQGCPGVITSQCCPDGASATPRALHAQAVGSLGCCGTIDLVLAFNPIEGAWVGGDENSMCGHEIDLRLTCSGQGWQLTFSGEPCVEESVFAELGSTCDPLDLEFVVPLNGLSCCSGAANGTLTVTITE